MKYIVYLDGNVNRLILVNEPIDNKDFIELMNIQFITETQQMTLAICKTFCIGYIIGCGNQKPINDINEFK